MIFNPVDEAQRKDKNKCDITARKTIMSASMTRHARLFPKIQITTHRGQKLWLK